MNRAVEYFGALGDLECALSKLTDAGLPQVTAIQAVRDRALENAIEHGLDVVLEQALGSSFPGDASSNVHVHASTGKPKLVTTANGYSIWVGMVSIKNESGERSILRVLSKDPRREPTGQQSVS